LKCGTYFSGTCTFSPDFGLRPTRRPVVQRKAAEAANLDAIAAGERGGHGIENHLHRVIGILGDQLREAPASFAMSSDLVMFA
jgi:hypothetical protein